MQGIHDRKKISWHLKDLLGRDYRVVYEVVEWAAPTADDLRSRRYPKHLAARWAAAKMIQTAVEEGNSGLFTHILDRTEGKVADRLEVSERKTLTLHLDLGQAQVIEGQVTPLQVVGTLQDNPNMLSGLHNGSYQTLASDEPSDTDADGRVDVSDQTPGVEPTPSTLFPNREGGEGGA